jgi:S1-C subfamily serine protease
MPAPSDPCPVRNERTYTISYVRHSVVDIHVVMTYLTDGENPTTYEMEWGGSGLILDAQGRVLTNWHVADDQKTPIKRDYKITLADGRVFSAVFLRADMDVDLGLLQICDPPEGLWGAVLGDYDPILGQDALVFGSPRGLRGTVTHGIVSGLDREINVRLCRHLSSPQTSVLYKGLLQIDAPINPGNSGGPVTDLYGRVIGLVNCGGSGDGMGFAVPLKNIKKFLNG